MIRVRISVRDAVDRAVLSRTDVRLHAIARAEKIGVHEVAVQKKPLRTRIADAAAELPGKSLIDVEIDVDEVRRPGHRVGVDLHLLDVGQALQSGLGAFELAVGKVAALELAHLPAQDLVVHRRSTVEIDAPDIHTVLRLDVEGDGGGLLGLVELRHGFDGREGIALLAEPQPDEVGALRDDAL